MIAATYETYGGPDVVHLTEVPTPVPKRNEVLIQTYATTVTSGDWRVRSLILPPGFGAMGRLMFGLRKPRQPILGTELSGVVASVGQDVTRFKPGDAVFAFGDAAMGCHAEYKCMPEDGALAPKPATLSYEEAAALSFGGTTALSFFQRAKLQPGERVLINGASGGVGTAAVQLARHFGAEVTGVCSTANVDLVRSLGATHVIDYTKDDFTQNGETYDVIMDVAGTAPYSRSRRSLNEGGRLLLVLAGLSEMLQAPFSTLRDSRRILAGPVTATADDLRFLAELAETGGYRPVIGRQYPFEQIAEAHRYVDTGHKRGNVVVTLERTLGSE